MEELSTLAIAEFDAQTRFQTLAMQGDFDGLKIKNWFNISEGGV